MALALLTRGLRVDRGLERPALDGLELELPVGRLALLKGANGAGKSTLLRVAAGLLRPDAGTVEVFGGDPYRSRPLRRRIAFVAQDPALDPEMNVRETLELLATLSISDRGLRRRAIEEASATWGLLPFGERRVQALSGGWRRRLHIALGLLGPFDFLLLDEPWAGLDADASTLLWQVLRARVDGGATVLAAAHGREAAAPETGVDMVLHLPSASTATDGDVRPSGRRGGGRGR
jgi:ABC-2 type transport system ATP-binding protein